jgi:putative PIN family toxin of toxin-antitoxin system
MVEALLTGHHLFTCDEILDEVNEKLTLPRLQKYIDSERAQQLVASYTSKATRLEVINHVQVCRDPDDDIVLALAATAEADFIITGDNDLLILHPYQNIQIVTPATFTDKFL